MDLSKKKPGHHTHGPYRRAQGFIKDLSCNFGTVILSKHYIGHFFFTSLLKSASDLQKRCPSKSVTISFCVLITDPLLSKLASTHCQFSGQVLRRNILYVTVPYLTKAAISSFCYVLVDEGHFCWLVKVGCVQTKVLMKSSISSMSWSPVYVQPPSGVQYVPQGPCGVLYMFKKVVVESSICSTS